MGRTSGNSGYILVRRERRRNKEEGEKV